jgi:hypothetical protein
MKPEEWLAYVPIGTLIPAASITCDMPPFKDKNGEQYWITTSGPPSFFEEKLWVRLRLVTDPNSVQFWLLEYRQKPRQPEQALADLANALPK